EAVFDIKGRQLKPFFEENDIDYEETTIIRREITSNGKSRVFINDTPYTLNILKGLILQIIDIHSQHQNLHLSNNQFQLEVIDSLASHDELLYDYNHNYDDYKKLLKEFEQLKHKIKQIEEERDYYTFQFDQLEKAKLEEHEQEELEAELNELDHAEEIRKSLSEVIHIFYDEQSSTLDKLKEAASQIEKVQKYISKTKDLSRRLESAYIEIQDIASEVDSIAENVEYDPQRLNFIKERLDLIYGLQQKHHVNTVTELLNVKKDIQEKLDEIDSSDLRFNEIQTKIEEKKKTLEHYASQISENRLAIKPLLETKVNDLLRQLAIPNASFLVHHEYTDDFVSTGRDLIKFLFSANKNQKEYDISEVASGGELSRLMLSLKYLISQSKSLPAIVFDEIDAGISGETAYKMGTIFKSMAEHMQVINITHLPQIASKGDHHYLVYKTDDDKGTYTGIKLLDKDERVHEIAKMISGEKITDASLKNAKELLDGHYLQTL
ncbi:MAG: DNA repair protein RecN, partial [Bacteroidota bacterium]